MLGEWIRHAHLYGDRANGLMARRQRTELVDTIGRSKQIFTPLGARYHEQEKRWDFPDGATLRFAYLENDSDAEAYQGHSYSRVYVEEIGNFPNDGPPRKLMATLRSATGVPVGFRSTGNPGGPGHQWVKARYIDPAPSGYQILRESFTNPFSGKSVEAERVFIPSRLDDNRFLGDDYIARLHLAGNEKLVRAWLLGDWNIVVGAFFDEFVYARHVVKPLELPKHWTRIRAMDWGSAKPFSVGWYAVSDGELQQFPRGALVKYREWYGVAKDHNGNFRPNVGLKMTATAVAEGIKQRETAREVSHAVIDPSAFTADGGPSIAERMGEAGVHWSRADNKRIAAAGAIGGWDQVRERLKGEDGRPMLYFFDTCIHTIRTLPALQHDEKRPEDVDTDAEDHAPDETRYACMARPWIRDAAKPEEVRWPHQQTISDIVAARRRKRMASE